MNLGVFLIGHQVAGGRFMLQVVDAGTDIDQRLERRVRGDVFDPFTVDVDGTAVPNGGFVFFTGPYHVRSCSNVSMFTRSRQLLSRIVFSRKNRTFRLSA